MKTRGSRNKSRRVLINHNGYAQVFEPKHPMAMKNGYVLLHRMMAYDSGLLTDRSMEINHINSDKLDNRLDNFEVLTKAAHARISTPLGTKRPRHDSRKCLKCNKLTASEYGLCSYHYRSAWANGTLEVIRRPNLLEKET
jgi:hypothetical protein